MMRINVKKIIIGCFFLAIAVLFLPLNDIKAYAVDTAEEVSVTFTHSAGKDCSVMTDGDTSKSVAFSAGQTLTIKADEPIMGIYIKWSVVKKPSEWTIVANGVEKRCGQYGFLHEYVELPAVSDSCTLVFSGEKPAGIVELVAYGYGTLPRDVQVWEPTCERADVLAFATHADDEVLFLGGAITTYAGEKGLSTQVVYLCDFALEDYGYGNTKREHEKLDGLWTMGVTKYPINGHYPDVYSGSLATAKTQYDFDDVIRFTTECIRRFKPMIVLSQDFKGEYGHGAHMLFAAAVAEALEKSNDPSYDTDSLNRYGFWDVPKAYYHLYEKNKIRLDLRTPLKNFNGDTSLEVQKVAYKKHVTQQVTRFYITDEYAKYDCAAFGLYRSWVGADTGNDMDENIVTYESLAEEALTLARRNGNRFFLAPLYSDITDCLNEAKKY